MIFLQGPFFHNRIHKNYYARLRCRKVFMIINKLADIRSSEITPEHIYLARRDFMRGTIASGVLGAATLSAGKYVQG